MDRHIRIVDDDEDTRAVLADILSDLGYSVDTASNGHSALERARERPYRLALLDYRMPDLTGVDLFRRLRELCGGMEGVLISAFLTPEATAEAFSAGIRHVLHKPLDVPRLVPLVEEAIE